MTRRAYLFLFAWLAVGPACAEEPQSIMLTTDTPQYCAQLQKQVADRHSQLPDVQRLLAEGTGMCARGEIRGGIRHLRRALVMLHHHRLAKDGARDAMAKPSAVMPAAPAPALKPSSPPN